jgi:hypothetical protein
MVGFGAIGQFALGNGPTPSPALTPISTSSSAVSGHAPEGWPASRYLGSTANIEPSSLNATSSTCFLSSSEMN